MQNNVLEYLREILMSIVPKNMTLIFHLNIPEHYSTYTLFTASISNTVFVVLNIPHSHKIQLKETEEETKNVG